MIAVRYACMEMILYELLCQIVLINYIGHCKKCFFGVVNKTQFIGVLLYYAVIKE